MQVITLLPRFLIRRVILYFKRHFLSDHLRSVSEWDDNSLYLFQIYSCIKGEIFLLFFILSKIFWEKTYIHILLI